MLRTFGALFCAAIGVIVTTGSAIAATPPPPVVVSGNNDGVVQTVVNDPGHPGTTKHSGGSSTSSGSSCTWQQVILIERIPLPYPEPGTWWQEYCSGSGKGPLIFVPTHAPNGPVSATPITLAQQAVSRMVLPAALAEHNPPGDAVTNLATWWWLDRSSWKVLTQRTTVGPVWAVVTARPVRSVWDAGDGSTPLVCDGPGTPYNSSLPASNQSTSCSHTYAASSASQPQTGPSPNDRFYTVRVTVVWQVSWVGAGGTGGALPTMTRTTSFPLRVVDRDTVVSGGAG